MTRRSGAEVLLTGATGFLGKVVLHDLLARREELGIERIHLLIRPTRRAPEERFRQEIEASPALAGLGDDLRRHARVVPGDLADADGLRDAGDRLSGNLTHVIHCAASVDFELPVNEALAANTTSALAVLELARRCPGLESMVAVSTAYVTPHPGDRTPIPETLAPLPRAARAIHDAIRSAGVDETSLLRETRHPNTYTLTKCLTEHLLVEQRGDVPLTLVRPSIISASLARPAPGWIDSPAAFALFIMAIGTAKLRAVVARPSARLDVIPCDEASQRVVDAAFAPPPGGLRIRHAVAGYERSLPLWLCREGIVSWFQRNPVTVRREGAAGVHYLGPPGRRHRRQHRKHHLGRRGAHLVAPSLESMNERFATFTRNTFRFESSAPFDAPGFDPRAYVETVSRGVAVHLLDADLGAVSLAGRSHPEPPPSLWQRLRGATRTARALSDVAEAVTFDRLSFERATAGLPRGAALALGSSSKDPLEGILLAHLIARHRDLWPRRVRVAPPAESGRTGRKGELRLDVSFQREPDRIHLVCESPPLR